MGGWEPERGRGGRRREEEGVKLPGPPARPCRGRTVPAACFPHRDCGRGGERRKGQLNKR